MTRNQTSAKYNWRRVDEASKITQCVSPRNSWVTKCHPNKGHYVPSLDMARKKRPNHILDWEMTPLKFDWSTYFPKSTLESSFNVSNVFSWDYVGFQNILLLHFTSRIRAHKKETLSSFIHLLGNVCLEHAKPTKCSPISLNVGLKTSMASNFRNSSLLKCQQLRHI